MNTKRSFDRRSFIQGSGAMLAGAVGFPYIVSASALGADGAVAASERITIGSIGVGGQGTWKVKDFLGIPVAQIVAVCDVQQSEREKAKRIVDEKYGNSDCAMYNDFRELLARDDIDAVVIATQDHWHALIAVAAAQAGKDMYCEKPLGVAVAESQAIRDAVRKYGIVFQTGTQQRSERNFRFACQLARSGYLGKIHTVKVGAPGPVYKREYLNPLVEEPIPPGFDWDMWLGPAPKKPFNGGRVYGIDWYLIWDYCAGFIVNWGVHHLDIANWGCPDVANQPCELEFTGTYRHDGLTDNIFDWKGEFRYESGLKMVYISADEGTEECGCTFYGDKGWVHVDRPGIWAEPQSLLKVQLKSSDNRLYESNDHRADFLRCVKTRKDPVSPVEAGHKASSLGMIAETSVRLKRKLKWDPAKESFVGDEEANNLLTRPMRSPWHL